MPAHYPSGSPRSPPAGPAVAGQALHSHRSPARRAAGHPASGCGARRHHRSRQPEPPRHERSPLRGAASPGTSGPSDGWGRRRPSVREEAAAAVDRAVRVLAAINEVASAEGVAVAVRHVCVACAAAVQASGVGLYLRGEQGLCEPLYVSTAVSEQVAELQVMLGEGPGTDALGREYPVLVPALGSAASLLRGPSSAPAALAVGGSGARAC